VPPPGVVDTVEPRVPMLVDVVEPWCTVVVVEPS
jgi:hypothetical protein